MPNSNITRILPGTLKELVHQGLNKLGYQLVKKVRKNEVRLPLLAAKELLKDRSARPVFFDVGANAGQTTRTMKELFPNAVIHAFEPGSTAFAQLSKGLANVTDVHLHQAAVGAEPGRISLNENTESTMSSILPLGDAGWGTVSQVREVEMTTVDETCRKEGVQHLHILKSDTQGYDLEVLRGASGMMDQRRIDCVFFELIFSNLYHGMPRFDSVFSFLLDHGFTLVNIYDMHVKNGAAAWADVLFIRRDILTGVNS